MNHNQIYHLEPPYGLINDPNALIEFNGKFYVFFQWNSLAKDHSYKEWGYFTTENFLDWNFEGKAIKANSFFDKNGVYSGTGLVYDGKIYLYYTGNTKPGGVRKTYQNLVTSEDGVKFEKEGILFVTPEGFTEHVRDPKVFKRDNRFYLILGAQETSGYGSIILYVSVNPIDFHFKKIIAQTKKFEMVECPDMAFFGDKVLLNYALQARDNEKDTALSAESFYKIEHFDFDDLEFNNSNLDENLGLIDYGYDFYVPQTVKLENGITLMVGWMGNMSKEATITYSKDNYYVHCLSMFREISIKDNHLYQLPYRVYRELLADHYSFTDNSVELPKRQYYLKFSFKHCHSFEVSLNDELKFVYEDQVFKTVRKNWVTGKVDSKDLDLKKLTDLEIWADTSSIEAYINHGEYTSSSKIQPKSEKVEIKYKLDGELTDSEARTIQRNDS